MQISELEMVSNLLLPFIYLWHGIKKKEVIIHFKMISTEKYTYELIIRSHELIIRSRLGTCFKTLEMIKSSTNAGVYKFFRLQPSLKSVFAKQQSSFRTLAAD